MVKITRCSDPFSSMADALSKGAFCRFRELGRLVPNWSQPVLPLPLPTAILNWVANPTADWDLGGAILDELRQQGLGLQPQL